MRRIKAEVARAYKRIEEALKDLPQVTFGLDMSFHYSLNSHHMVSVVTLWFGHSFKKTVQGGEDTRWLAREARRVAKEYLAKIRETAKAVQEGKRA